MMHSWQWALDQLFPPRETELQVRNTENLTPWYRPQRADGVMALCDYRDPVIKAAVLENKFWANDRATRLLSELLAEWLPAEPITIVPIPLSPQRYRERGYNQVERVITALKERPVPVCRCLKRTRHTAPQMDLPRRERLANLTDAFAFHATRSITTQRVILLDDVMTTGATMRAARAKLAPRLPPATELTCVALAH